MSDTFKNTCVKLRKARKSSRGIYLQDSELQKTAFIPGSHYQYIIDSKNQKIIIMPSDKGNTVSKRIRHKEATANPVIDIRSKEALNAVGAFDYLKVEILYDQIIVSGWTDTSVELGKERHLKLIGSGKSKVLRKRFAYTFPACHLDQVVGGEFQQINLFDSISGYNEILSDVAHHYDSLQHIDIPLKVASLFSGAGLMDYAFLQSGFEVAFAVERDADACSTYRQNVGDIICMDINSMKIEDYLLFHSPIVIGGPPCQGFSNANRRTSFLDNPNNLMMKKMINAIKLNKKCKVFLIENVPELLTAGNGAFLDEICEKLDDYTISSGVLNAVDMGDPQNRKRAFVIGSKIGKINLPVPQIINGGYSTVAEAFAGLNDLVPNQLDVSKPSIATVSRMECVKQGSNWRDIPDSLKTEGMLKGKTHSSVYKRLHPNEPSVTIVNPRKINLTHPTLNRSLTIRECARLFGLPDSFVFKGTLNSMQQQVCNGVPFRLVSAVAKGIKEAIIGYNSSDLGVAE